jgi:peptide/nickel transport system substrate-binding protein
MRRQRRSLKLLALILGLSMVAAACGGDDDDTADTADEDTDVATQEGGELVIGAEQEPECMDWIASCAGSSWGSWVTSYNSMPRSFDIVKDGDQWVYEPSNLLAEEPTIEGDPQVVTYEIAEEAVWSDETPITCADYLYTWDQVKNGEDIYDRTGYVDIESVECPDGEDGKAVVANFSKNYAGWQQLFGGQFGVFPAHLLEGKDRNAEMATGYDWSGGPWKLESWTPEQSIVLVPNENYWGTVPTLEKVTFQLMADTDSAFEAFKAGTVKAMYPQPQLDAVEEIAAGIPGASSSVNADSTPNLEALWINNAKPPFDSVAVRQAFAYSLDRDAIVEALFGGLGITEAVQSLNASILGDDFGNQDAFADYQQDLDQVDELMEGEGWAKGSDGIWAKGGQRASIVFKTTDGNARRELTQQEIQKQAQEAGFEITIDNQAAGDLFGDQLPKGDFQLALYAQVLTSLDPSLSSLFLSANVPTAENQFSGQNWTRSIIDGLDEPLNTMDTESDPEARSEAAAEVDDLLAENMASLPLDPLPNIFLWSDDIVGPAEGEDNPIFGPFSNMNEWALKA